MGDPLGPSPEQTVGRDPRHIRHKAWGGAERRGGGHRKRGPGRTIEPFGEPRTSGLEHSGDRPRPTCPRGLQGHSRGWAAAYKAVAGERMWVCRLGRWVLLKVAVAECQFEAVLGKTRRTEF